MAKAEPKKPYKPFSIVTNKTQGVLSLPVGPEDYVRLEPTDIADSNSPKEVKEWPKAKLTQEQAKFLWDSVGFQNLLAKGEVEVS